MSLGISLRGVIVGCVGLLSTVLIATWVAGAGSPADAVGFGARPHLLLALCCALLAGPIFAYGLATRAQGAPKALVTGALFAASGIMILIHGLTLPGLSGSSDATTNLFSLGAQLLLGTAFFLCATRFPVRWNTPACRNSLLVVITSGTLLFAALLFALGRTQVPTEGALRWMSYVIAIIDAMALAGTLRYLQQKPGRGHTPLAVGALINLLGQLLICMGGEHAHLAGHFYALLALSCVCRTAYIRAVDDTSVLLTASRGELEASQAQLRSRSEMSSDWYWEQDNQFRFTYTSKLADSVPTTKHEAIAVGKTHWELPYIDAPAEQWQAHKTVLETHQPFRDFEFVLSQPGDDLRFFSAAGRPVFASDGTFMGYRGVTAEITARKRAELLLAAENRLLEMLSSGQALNDTLTRLCQETEQLVQRDAIAVVSYVENIVTRRVVATSRLSESLRQTLEDNLGSSFAWLDEAPPATAQGLATIRDIGGNTNSAPWQEDLRNAGLVTVWSSPIISRESRLGYLMLFFPGPRGASSDHERQFLGRITQLATIAIERSKGAESTRFAIKALESAREGVRIVDTNYRILYVNPAYGKITGYSADETIGIRSPSFATGLHSPAFYEQYMEIVRQNGHWTGEYWERRKDGKLYYKWMSIVAIKDIEGRITHYSTVTADMTDQKQAELLLRLRHNITEALSDPNSEAEAVGKALALISKAHDWDFAACWCPSAPDGSMTCLAHWVAPQRQLEGFSRLIDEARIMVTDATPASSVDAQRLGDMARRSGYPVKAANAAGLREVLTLPVVIDCNVVALLEFRNKLPRSVEPHVSEMIRSLGNQIGSFLVRQRSEKLLRDQEAELRQITDNIPASIAHFDRHLRVKFANREYAARRGLTPEMVIGRNVAEIYDFKTNLDILEYCKQVLEGREVSFIKDTTMPGGAIRVTSVTMLPERNASGGIDGIFSIGVDITRQFNAESDIRALNQDLEKQVTERQVQNSVLRTQLETSPDAIMLAGKNANILSYNKNFVEMFGLKEEMLLAGKEEPLIQAFRAKVADPETWFRKVRYLYAHPEEKSRDTFRLKDGRLIDRFTSPVVDEQGVYHGRVWHLRDITEQVAAEQEILALNRDLEVRIKERQFQNTVLQTQLEASPDSIALIDENARILSYNGRFLEMFSIPPPLMEIGAADVVLRAGATLVDNPEAFIDRMQYFFERRIEETRDRVSLTDGRMIDIYSAPVVSDSGNYYGRVWYCRDVTAQVSAEHEILTMNRELERRVAERTQILEAVVKELEAFSYSVSHDLRAPLRAIDGFAHLLDRRYSDKLDETGKNHLERIRRNSTRMGQLIDDLLLLSQMTRGDFSRSRVNLSEISRTFLLDRMTASPERAVSLDIEDDIVVEGDPRLLRIAMENILENAWKFTSRHDAAIITIGTEATPDGQVVFVRDNGAGFDMRYAEKMFGAFQRLHSSFEYEGTGVGLAIVQRVINRHGGRIWAEGSIGAGATIRFVV